MSRIKILYIHHGSGEGGAPLSLLYLIRELDREKYEPVVACDFGQQSAYEFFKLEGLDTYDSRARCFSHTSASSWRVYSPRHLAVLIKWLIYRFPKGCKGIKTVLHKTSPDIVHLNSVTLLPYAPTIRRTKVPIVVHVREPVARGLFGIRRAWLCWLARNAVDAIVYICKENKSQLTGDNPKARMIYNFVDFDKFDRNIDQRTTRKRLGIPEESKVVLFPGGSGLAIKGIFPLIEALVKLRRQFPNLTCLLPGGIIRPGRKVGWLKELLRGRKAETQIEPLIRRVGLNDVVIRTPFSHAMEHFYAAADVVVVPFTAPHFARAVIESGAMAKPVVASRIGGVAEVVEDNVTGLLVEPGNEEDIAEKIAIVLNDSTLACKLGEEGYAQAIRLFDAKRNAAATIQVYKEVLNNK